MTRAVIIDDEDHARENLRSILKANFDNIEIVGEGNSVDTGVVVIKNKKPELVFLDIDLSDGSGFNVLEKVGETNFHVIFITAFNEYAIKAFRYNALDYILKPIDIELLNQAIAKIEYDKGKEYITRDELKEILNNLINSEEDKKLIIKDKNSTSYVRIGDIIRCEADGSYTIIHLVNGDKVVVSRALKVYSSLLPESMFFRVHQSNLINLRCVKKISKKDGGYVMMEDGTDVPIARRRKEEFLEALENSIS